MEKKARRKNVLLSPKFKNLNSEPQDVVIAIMARSPIGSPNQIKTRLSSMLPIDSDRIKLYTAFLIDTITACQTITSAALRIAYTPEDGSETFDLCSIGDLRLLPQRGINLSERERFLFEDLFSAGFKKVILIGSDLPTLPTAYLRDTISKLNDQTSTVVLGPAEDGGYYLIGLNATQAGWNVPDLFTNIRWSTSFAFEDTVRAAKLNSVKVKLIKTWYDVDDAQGMRRLKTSLQDPEQCKRAPRTAAVMRKLKKCRSL